MYRKSFACGVGFVALLVAPSALGQQALPNIDIAAARPSRATGPSVTQAPPQTPVAAPATPTESKPADAAVIDKREIADQASGAADTTQLLQNTPGVSMQENGGVSRLPIIHGMADDRINTIVGGVRVTSACGNHMNPPLSYVDPNNVGSMTVYTGVMPVSKGGDSIGGAIIVEPRSPVFASAPPPAADATGPGAVSPIILGPGPFPGTDRMRIQNIVDRYVGSDGAVLANGQISTFFRSSNNGIGVSGTANVATEHFSLLYNGAWTRGGDYHAGGRGEKVLSSGFISENHAATLAFQNNGHLFSVRGSYERVPYQGYPNVRMDMTRNIGWQVDAKYLGAYDWGNLEARAYWHGAVHKMGFLRDKQPDNMPMATDGNNFGYTLGADHRWDPANLFRAGSEFHGFRYHDYWEPIPGGGIMAATDMTTIPYTPGSFQQKVKPMVMLMMAPFTNWTINNARRDRLAHYAEWEHDFSPQLSSLLGVRNELVWMDTGRAAAYDPRFYAPMPMLMPGGAWVNMTMIYPDALAANYFNASNRRRLDVNWDATAQMRYRPDNFTLYELGYSRKTRSPNVYERYQWAVGTMTSAMIGWFGDANGYVGNLNLKPEVAHNFSLTGSWRDPNGNWDARMAPYFSYIENYIDADRVGDFQFTGPAPPGPYVFRELQFRNHKAMIYGVDVSGRVKLADIPGVGAFTATALINYVYGKNLDQGSVQYCGPYDLRCTILAPLNKVGDGLYNMMPLNAKFGLEHHLGGWSSRAEVVLVDSKTHVSIHRNELKTPGYALLNLRTSYEWDNVRIDLGLDNVFDHLYYPPLGGFYITNYKAMTAAIWNYTRAFAPTPNSRAVSGVPGVGRNFTVGMTVKF